MVIFINSAYWLHSKQRENHLQSFVQYAVLYEGVETERSSRGKREREGGNRETEGERQ